MSEWVSEWLLLTPTQQFHSYIMARTTLDPLCTRTTRSVIFFYCANSLKQQSAGRHVVPLGHFILIDFRANQSLLFLHNAACLAKKQHISIASSLVWSGRGSNPRSTALATNALTITPPMRFFKSYTLISSKVNGDICLPSLS